MFSPRDAVTSSSFKDRDMKPQQQRVSHCGAVMAMLGLAFFSSTALAAPYVPTSDLAPLEKLATRVNDSARGAGSTAFSASGSSSSSSRAMRTILARDPKNLDLALRVAQVYMARARSESDPRYLGQAQAALATWWSQSEPPIPVLLLRATIRQSNHDFKNSRRDLEQAVKREPSNAQAWLTLATVQQVTGDINAAADSCNKLLPLTARLISTVCVAAVDGARGQAAKAFAAIDAVIAEADASRGANVGVRTWALTLQAELAERLARPADADRLYRASLALDSGDAYTVAAYSDFLIDVGRANDVLALIPATTKVDTLLLRRAIAAKIVASPDAAQVAEDLTQRFAASRARGDRIHLREEARFVLVVKNSPDEAVNLALDNWTVQKEPLDARIVLEAAVAARQSKASREVVLWVASTQLQGEKLGKLVTQARAL